MRHTEDLLLALGGALVVLASSPQTRDLVPIHVGGDLESARQAEVACVAQEKEEVLRTLDLDATASSELYVVEQDHPGLVLSCAEDPHLATAESPLKGR